MAHRLPVADEFDLVEPGGDLRMADCSLVPSFQISHTRSACARRCSDARPQRALLALDHQIDDRRRINTTGTRMTSARWLCLWPDPITPADAAALLAAAAGAERLSLIKGVNDPGPIAREFYNLVQDIIRKAFRDALVGRLPSGAAYRHRAAAFIRQCQSPPDFVRPYCQGPNRIWREKCALPQG
jgi:hypothetical protein